MNGRFKSYLAAANHSPTQTNQQARQLARDVWWLRDEVSRLVERANVLAEENKRLKEPKS